MKRWAPTLAALLLGAVLNGCATFRDDEPDPYAPLAPHEYRDASGRRCVDASVFDVLDALDRGGRAP